MFSKLKSEVAPEEKRRVTRQMTATALNSRNPLHIPEILENVLKFLPVDDLKSCRLVNSLWKDTALKPMKKKSAHVTFRDYRGYSGLKDMERFLQCFTVPNSSGSGSTGEDRDFQRDIPCTKFELFTNIINEQSSDRDKSIVAKFLHAISRWVTVIILKNRGKDFDHFLKGFAELKFPYLRRTAFICIGLGKGVDGAFSPWMSVFIKNSPRLEEISFWGYRNTIENPRDPSIPLFLDTLQSVQKNRGLNIKELTIAADLEDGDFLKLSSSGLKLKDLTLIVLNSWQKGQLMNNLLEFLERQCGSLETLMILNLFEFPLLGVSLPRMKNLSSLVFQGGSTGMVNYRSQFPALKSVIFSKLNNNNWQNYLQPEMEPTESVTDLSFSQAYPSVETIFEAVRIFPRVTKLTMSAFPLGLPIVYDSWPNLQDLTLYTEEGSCIDRVLTGLDEDGYQEALHRMRNWTPNFDESGIRIGFNHSPISNMTNLKVLRLEALEQHGKQLEITKVSICLALMKMPSLKVLDFGDRMRSPERSIPSRVLKEFRESRLILWKLQDIKRR